MRKLSLMTWWLLWAERSKVIFRIYLRFRFKSALIDLVRFVTIASRHGMAVHGHHPEDRKGKSSMGGINWSYIRSIYQITPTSWEVWGIGTTKQVALLWQLQAISIFRFFFFFLLFMNPNLHFSCPKIWIVIPVSTASGAGVMVESGWCYSPILRLEWLNDWLFFFFLAYFYVHHR